MRLAIFALTLALAARDPPAPTPPRLVHNVQAKYFAEARKNKIEGEVALSIIVGADGHVRDPSVKKSLDPDLDRNALEAVKEWLFRPATKKNGEPVDSYATVEMNFRLNQP